MKSRKSLGSTLSLYSSSFAFKPQTHFQSVGLNYVFVIWPMTPCHSKCQQGIFPGRYSSSGITTFTLANSPFPRSRRKAELSDESHAHFQNWSHEPPLLNGSWREKKASYLHLMPKWLSVIVLDSLKFWLCLTRSQRIMVCDLFVNKASKVSCPRKLTVLQE